MIVFRPSLPPSSWMTTSVRPSELTSAARADWEMKPGTSGASETRAECCRNWRRVVINSLRSVQMGLRTGQQTCERGRKVALGGFDILAEQQAGEETRLLSHRCLLAVFRGKLFDWEGTRRR